jgi:hypothetical protein
VNNAGCNVRKRALDVTWDDWNLILDTNLRGAFFVAQSIAALMMPHGRGRIINIGSLTSVAGYAGLGPYGASRGGIRQLTMSLADDWGPHGITVNCLAPGWFKTDQNKVMYDDPEWVEYLVDRIPVRRPGRPGDLEGPVVFLRVRRQRSTSPGRRCWSTAGCLSAPCERCLDLIVWPPWTDRPSAAARDPRRLAAPAVPAGSAPVRRPIPGSPRSVGCSPSPSCRRRAFRPGPPSVSLTFSQRSSARRQSGLIRRLTLVDHRHRRHVVVCGGRWR